MPEGAEDGVARSVGGEDEIDAPDAGEAEPLEEVFRPGALREDEDGGTVDAHDPGPAADRLIGWW